MRDCDDGELRDLLPDYLHGSLDARARVAVESHLATCEACTAELSLLRAARGALSRTPAVDVARIVAGVRRATAAGAPPRAAAGAVGPRAGGARATRHVHAWRWMAAASLLVAASVIAYAAAHRQHAPAVLPVAARPENASRTVLPPSIAPSRPATSSASTLAVRDESSHVRRPASPIVPLDARPAAPDADALLGGLGDLSDDDARAMLERLDQVQALPDAEPAPILDEVGSDLVGAGVS